VKIKDVMTEIAERADTIDGLRVFDRPVGSATPPALIVLYPELVTYDQTYGRGLSKLDGGFVLLVGKPFVDSTVDRMSEYAAEEGDRSLKVALETGPNVSFDEITLVSLEFDVVSVGGVEYMAGVGKLEIFGQGAPR
jgi:hypothetical protein